jgi:hypothetical protein
VNLESSRGLFVKILGALVNWICNLEQNGGGGGGQSAKFVVEGLSGITFLK